MEFYRVFDWDGWSFDDKEGGPLFVPRALQGAGRHDNVSRYGAWYGSRTPVSAVAELLQHFRRQTLRDDDFSAPAGRTRALATLSLADDAEVVDLDDPQVLVARGIRPSQVATLRRTVTQRIALSVFDDGAEGISWWSTLEATWTNVTLFHERAIRHISLAAPPLKLSMRLPEVREAAAHLSVDLG